MTDEEKKAIEYLNKYCDTDLLYEQRHYNYIKMIIRLVGKQSKEIEELKMQLEVEKIDNKYNQEETHEETIPRYKLKEVLEKYKYTEIGNSEKIIEFYKELQSLLEKE